MKWIRKKQKKPTSSSSMASSSSFAPSSTAPSSSSHSSFTKSWISKFKLIRDKHSTSTPVHHQLVEINTWPEKQLLNPNQPIHSKHTYSPPVLPLNDVVDQPCKLLSMRNQYTPDGYKDDDNLPRRMKFEEVSGWRTRKNEIEDCQNGYQLCGIATTKYNGSRKVEKQEFVKKKDHDHRSPNFTPNSAGKQNHQTPMRSTRGDDRVAATTPELRKFFKSPMSSHQDHHNSATLHQVKGRHQKISDGDVAGTISNHHILQETVRSSLDKKEEEEKEDANSVEWERLKNAKLHEFKSRNRNNTQQQQQQQRKSVYIQGGKEGRSDVKSPKQGNIHFKVGKPCSPRTTKKDTIIRIKPLEDMRKAAAAQTRSIHNNTKKEKGKHASVEMKVARVIGHRGDHQLESCAVEKSSVNPGEDFKTSMMEMIAERGIRKPQELENLLACYLALNSDEYHDVIIKVFREVWSELDHGNFAVASSGG